MQKLADRSGTATGRCDVLMCHSCVIWLTIATLTSASPQTIAGSLRAGASKIDITPALPALPEGFQGISDPIYVRAIVIDEGRSKAAMVTVDTGVISTDTWSRVSTQIARDPGIPAPNLILTATHTHSVPFAGLDDIEIPILKAIRVPSENTVPARMSFGTGVSYIIVNRNIIDSETHRWWEGPNYEGPSDKTVSVLQFSTTDGNPIAVLYNYGVHAVVSGQLDEIGGDIPGAASRYVEDTLGGNAVALWSEGPLEIGTRYISIRHTSSAKFALPKLPNAGKISPMPCSPGEWVSIVKILA